ncbi:MAG: hypothetical protein KAQ85_09045, partial [Thermodesulfovibrionia bacterium]|nr:hypothetical protein [Thermodesulfovibrionia bacterium]
RVETTDAQGNKSVTFVRPTEGAVFPMTEARDFGRETTDLFGALGPLLTPENRQVAEDLIGRVSGDGVTEREFRAVEEFIKPRLPSTELTKVTKGGVESLQIEKEGLVTDIKRTPEEQEQLAVSKQAYFKLFGKKMGVVFMPGAGGELIPSFIGGGIPLTEEEQREFDFHKDILQKFGAQFPEAPEPEPVEEEEKQESFIMRILKKTGLIKDEKPELEGF